MQSSRSSRRRTNIGTQELTSAPIVARSRSPFRYSSARASGWSSSTSSTRRFIFRLPGAATIARRPDLRPLHGHGHRHDGDLSGASSSDFSHVFQTKEMRYLGRSDRPCDRLLGQVPSRQALRLPQRGSMRPVSSWGRLTALPHEVVELADRDRVAEALARPRPGIAYGMGRSYGDACLNPGGVLWSTARLDRLIAFDRDDRPAGLRGGRAAARHPAPDDPARLEPAGRAGHADRDRRRRHRQRRARQEPS